MADDILDTAEQCALLCADIYRAVALRLDDERARAVFLRLYDDKLRHAWRIRHASDATHALADAGAGGCATVAEGQAAASAVVLRTLEALLTYVRMHSCVDLAALTRRLRALEGNSDVLHLAAVAAGAPPDLSELLDDIAREDEDHARAVAALGVPPSPRVA